MHRPTLYCFVASAVFTLMAVVGTPLSFAGTFYGLLHAMVGPGPDFPGIFGLMIFAVALLVACTVAIVTGAPALGFFIAAISLLAGRSPATPAPATGNP